MRNKLIYKYIGKVLIGYSFLIFLPFIMGLFFNERTYSFLFMSLITFILGLLLTKLKTENMRLYARDGFRIVTVS